MHEDEPDMLGDVARIAGPCPKVDVALVSGLDQVRVDALEGVSAANDTLHNLQHPSVP